jgi:hypothetical protein
LVGSVSPTLTLLNRLQKHLLESAAVGFDQGNETGGSDLFGCLIYFELIFYPLINYPIVKFLTESGIRQSLCSGIGN